jgi:hypothetical protein
MEIAIVAVVLVVVIVAACGFGVFAALLKRIKFDP